MVTSEQGGGVEWDVDNKAASATEWHKDTERKKKKGGGGGYVMWNKNSVELKNRS